jgi:DNA-binding LytR/AlgR family response regulator
MLNVAICDDTLILRDNLEKLIHLYETENSIRFNLYLFENGEELLEKFDEDKTLFDLFFLDHFMKKLNGVETALHIRRFNTVCNIVFVSSFDNPYEFISVSPLQIIHKPANKEDVFKALDKVLSEKGL